MTVGLEVGVALGDGVAVGVKVGVEVGVNTGVCVVIIPLFALPAITGRYTATVAEGSASIACALAECFITESVIVSITAIVASTASCRRLVGIVVLLIFYFRFCLMLTVRVNSSLIFEIRA